ncbi:MULTISPECIES: acyltransferase [Enterobacter cloacae complex]|uniref:acyltransferase family protein n=1 Tax=Enterobacter cloacae complex TaxID=354276 RepID=UPI0003F9064D|nr:MULTISPECIES: acyltransferase [Enterobacter cloacae complex]
MKTHNEKNNDLQILRGIAIMMVIFQHYKWRLPSADWYADSVNYLSMWAGVDIFLALSGFLMYRVISREFSKSGHTFSAFKSFFIKRIFRLYPALIFWVAVSIPVAWYVAPFFNADGPLALKAALPSLLAYSNFYWYNCVVNGSVCGSSDLSGITWSLSLEWQLYILLFIAMFFFSKKTLPAILAIVFIISCVMSSDPVQVKSLVWWIRPQSFILGVAISLASQHTEILLSRIIRIAILAASLVLICVLPNQLPHVLLPLTVGVLGALCVLLCINGDIFGRSIFSNILLWIGDRSYSLYLCHLTVIHAFAKLIRDTDSLSFINNNGYIALAICISLLAITSHLSYKYIETPLLNKGRMFVLKYKA